MINAEPATPGTTVWDRVVPAKQVRARLDASSGVIVLFRRSSRTLTTVTSWRGCRIVAEGQPGQRWAFRILERRSGPPGAVCRARLTVRIGTPATET